MEHFELIERDVIDQQFQDLDPLRPLRLHLRHNGTLFTVFLSVLRAPVVNISPW